MNNMILVIDKPKTEYEDDPEFKKIIDKLNPSMWGIDGDIETYCMKISLTTYKLIDNQFSFDFDRTIKNEGHLPYKTYLKEDEIKSLNFYDYGGEKIYRLLELHLDWYNVKSKDLLIVSTKLLSYISQNNLIENNELVLGDLEDLINLSSFCLSKGINFSFYDPNY